MGNIKRICPCCGASDSENIGFCENCGNKIEYPISQTTDMETNYGRETGGQSEKPSVTEMPVQPKTRKKAL